MKCNNCGTTIESNSLKCKCGAEIIHNKVQPTNRKSLWENILNFLSEEKHSISFLLIFSEVALMIYGFIMDFHFGSMFLYLFFGCIIFLILSTPFLVAKSIDENSNNIRMVNFSYIFGLILNFIFILFLFFYGSKEIDGNGYDLIPKNQIQSELDDKKITYFESFKILHRQYESLSEINKERRRDIDAQELKQRELTKEKILKEIIESKSQQNIQ